MELGLMNSNWMTKALGLGSQNKKRDEIIETFDFKKNHYRVVVANVPSTRKAIFRLRYEIYVEEMGRNQDSANHRSKILKDSLDDQATLLAVFCGTEVVATARLNFGADGRLPEDWLYNYDQFTDFDQSEACLTTKLMVKSSLRRSPICLKVCNALYEVAYKKGARISFIDSNAHLLKLYRRLGFQDYRGTISHPSYGDVTPMVLHMEDLNHLEKVGSPFTSTKTFEVVRNQIPLSVRQGPQQTKELDSKSLQYA